MCRFCRNAAIFSSYKSSFRSSPSGMTVQFFIGNSGKEFISVASSVICHLIYSLNSFSDIALGENRRKQNISKMRYAVRRYVTRPYPRCSEQDSRHPGTQNAPRPVRHRFLKKRKRKRKKCHFTLTIFMHV